METFAFVTAASVIALIVALVLAVREDKRPALNDLPPGLYRINIEGEIQREKDLDGFYVVDPHDGIRSSIDEHTELYIDALYRAWRVVG